MMQRKQKPAAAVKLTGKQHRALKDLAFMIDLLKQHPRAQAKIGPGVAAITVDRFVGRPRCYFVVRSDGTCEDLSLRRLARLSRVAPRSRR